jgi:formamidopyrimidine-DNA glycosylase
VPELPEVEVVRRGLERWVAGRTIAAVEVHHPRAVRRHLEGVEHFTTALTGRTLTAAHRRGKYLWLPMAEADGGAADQALVAHLGMSGQLLVEKPEEPDEVHLRARFRFTDGGRELRFVDQRTFGGLAVEDAPGDGIPPRLAHIAIDPLDPGFDADAFSAALRRRRTEVKRALLDQTLISGVGNIYADEALWMSRIHPEQPTATLSRRKATELLAAIREVFAEALAEGGTSFDAQYLNVNGESGYFSRRLKAYGRQGEPCLRCGRPIVRESFMNRGSHFCRHCQKIR